MSDAHQDSEPARSKKPMTLRELLLYRRFDTLSGWLICFLVVFTPWAFGSVRTWGIWTINITCYVLGLLFVAKCLLRCWRQSPPDRQSAVSKNAALSHSTDVLLAVLTLLLPGYCLVAALNARADYDAVKMVFNYTPFIEWLPHSYSSSATWHLLARYIALACFFWSLRDWLRGMDADEARAARDNDAGTRLLSFPQRLKWLVVVLSVNGALIGIEGIIQRLSGTPKPLWLLEMKINREAISQFGPFGYRSNAAQYLNLIWPVTLGLWWSLSRDARRRFARQDPRRYKPHWLLLPAAVLVVSAVFAASRGGAFVTFGCLALAAFVMVTAMRHRHASVKFGVLLLFGTLLSLGLYFGWDQLAERLSDTRGGYVGREALYETARKMARDYPLFGVGPGAFEPVYQLYRETPEDYWPKQLHNDWLEMLATFGWLGSAMIVVAMLTACFRWLRPGNPIVDWRFCVLVLISMTGVLAHARFDYPMQVYSILLLSVMLCGILFSLSSKPG